MTARLGSLTASRLPGRILATNLADWHSNTDAVLQELKSDCPQAKLSLPAPTFPNSKSYRQHDDGTKGNVLDSSPYPAQIGTEIAVCFFRQNSYMDYPVKRPPQRTDSC